jgi:Fur family ferric uptake transcriptional regulator
MIEVQQILKQYRIKNTSARRQVLAALLALKGKHFRTEDTIRYLRLANKKTSRASIFRAIQLFYEAGMLRMIESSKYGFKYECAIAEDHHDHLYCIRCGAIIEFREEAIEKLQEKVCRLKKFKPINHILKISGLCKKCSTAKGG